MADQLLDARHLKCPFPILKSKRALAGVPVGGTLEVLATDPGAPDDFVAFCESTGNTLLEQGVDDDGAYRFLIQRDH
jgi:tRNA 2-thiouridine synthesizing protein A